MVVPSGMHLANRLRYSILHSTHVFVIASVSWITHRCLVCLICTDNSIQFQLQEQFLNYFRSCCISKNETIRICAGLALHGSNSITCHNLISISHVVNASSRFRAIDKHYKISVKYSLYHVISVTLHLYLNLSAHELLQHCTIKPNAIQLGVAKG